MIKRFARSRGWTDTQHRHANMQMCGFAQTNFNKPGALTHLVQLYYVVMISGVWFMQTHITLCSLTYWF